MFPPGMLEFKTRVEVRWWMSAGHVACGTLPDQMVGRKQDGGTKDVNATLGCETYPLTVFLGSSSIGMPSCNIVFFFSV